MALPAGWWGGCGTASCCGVMALPATRDRAIPIDVPMPPQMWQQNYTPVAGNLALSAIVAALPIFVLLFALGIKRTAAWKAALTGLGSAVVVALFVYHMPARMTFSAVTYGAAFGLFPIGWIIYWAILLYRIALEAGKFGIIKDSLGSLTQDQHLQALLIAFAFGAFIEGACGFGTPVAVAAAMLAGLGFSPFYAAAICLLANTAPVAFGALGLPLITLSGVTGLPLRSLSADVGRICAPISLTLPSYLVVVMGGWSALRSILPAALLCGVAFAGVQLFVSNSLGPYLTDILASLTAIASLVLLLRFWKPKHVSAQHNHNTMAAMHHHTVGEILTGWAPYGLLVILVLVWGLDSVKVWLNSATFLFPWPGLHNNVQRIPPEVAKASPYAATFTLNLLSGAGTASMVAALLSTVILRVPLRLAARIISATAKQLLFPIITITAVVALAFLMNYSGATATLGLAFAATAGLFPFFSPMLGWLGVFLSGSDTSANALFGNLQVVTANRVGLNPVLMAASNSSGGVMGKMISLQSIAVAAAATGIKAADESRLFRFTLRHSVLLGSMIGLITVFYAYIMPHWAK